MFVRWHIRAPTLVHDRPRHGIVGIHRLAPGGRVDRARCDGARPLARRRGGRRVGSARRRAGRWTCSTIARCASRPHGRTSRTSFISRASRSGAHSRSSGMGTSCRRRTCSPAPWRAAVASRRASSSSRRRRRAGRPRRPIGLYARTTRRARSRRYGQSKLEAEEAARRYAGQLPVTIVRPAAVYGPRDRDFLRAFRLAARSIAIHAVPRENRFSIVHVADLVDALVRAGDRPEAVGAPTTSPTTRR